MARQLCIEPGCDRPKRKGVHRCVWHWLERQPIERQVEAAQWRLKKRQAAAGYQYRAKVPKADWPDGGRFCAGCQSFIPLHYTRGSRCRACASQAAHASHVERTYLRPDGRPFTEADYQKLLLAQGGRCYICGRDAIKRLAIDHSHTTGVVRGLLCSSPDWGCNLKVVAILEGAPDPIASARRLVSYLQGDTPASRCLT